MIFVFLFLIYLTLYFFYYLNVIDRKRFNIHLDNKLLATGLNFCKNSLVNNVLIKKFQMYRKLSNQYM